MPGQVERQAGHRGEVGAVHLVQRSTHRRFQAGRLAGGEGEGQTPLILAGEHLARLIDSYKR
ncbi:hypothetical protein ACFUAG_35205 [Streptomyces sp. NPDC057193]|uniref:hypothetical protein n=1 Tax=Streptomyces sp. NPDC057193 TaxID=3346043 RepID=UPI00363B12C8